MKLLLLKVVLDENIKVWKLVLMKNITETMTIDTKVLAFKRNCIIHSVLKKCAILAKKGKSYINQVDPKLSASLLL